MTKESLTMSHWHDHDFESSTTNTPEFDAFVEDLKSYVRQELPSCCIIFNRGHFFVSMFLVYDLNKTFYIELPDVRYNRWSVNVKFRETAHTTDWIGYENHYCCIGDIGKIPRRLFG